MVKKYEFELKKTRDEGGITLFSVYRKGLNMGMLVLDERYNDIEVEEMVLK